MKHQMKLLLFLCATSPILLGAKCVDYDNRYGGAATSSGDQTPAPSAPADAADTGGNVAEVGPTAEAAAPVFTPGKACETPKTATIKVQNRMFIIDCGCAETSGKTCSVPPGTTVRWQFADSTEHNVSGSMIGPSGEALTGNYEATFPNPGTYKYGCSIHRDMRDYNIVVK
jgi:plastocyanin